MVVIIFLANVYAYMSLSISSTCQLIISRTMDCTVCMI
uniref:Uncharacterized protein n=1 Tax=Arundo donax TaxID=35708 RepID=A0A0A9E282_ARUDO